MMGARIRRINPAKDLRDLRERAAADDHVVLTPTHVVEKDGEIVGYLSIGAVPIVNVWMDSEKLGPRDSVAVLGQLDAVMDYAGQPLYYMPCDKASPFSPVMEKLGFARLMETQMFVRKAR